MSRQEEAECRVDAALARVRQVETDLQGLLNPNKFEVRREGKKELGFRVVCNGNVVACWAEPHALVVPAIVNQSVVIFPDTLTEIEFYTIRRVCEITQSSYSVSYGYTPKA